MRVTGSGAAEKATSMIDRVFDVEPTALTTRVLHRDKLRLIESLTSIGNGHMGMRGNFEEGYSGDHHLGTFAQFVELLDLVGIEASLFLKDENHYQTNPNYR